MVFAGDVVDMNIGRGNDNYNESNSNDMIKG